MNTLLITLFVILMIGACVFMLVLGTALHDQIEIE